MLAKISIIKSVLNSLTAECAHYKCMKNLVHYCRMQLTQSSRTRVSKLQSASWMRPSRLSHPACGDFLPTEKLVEFTRILPKSTPYMGVTLNSNFTTARKSGNILLTYLKANAS